MVEVEPPKEKDHLIAKVEAWGNQAARLPIVVEWLRPLAEAAPHAVKEIIGRVESVATTRGAAIARPASSIPPILLSFILFVLAPAFAASLYFAFLASDQYTVEAQFAVRSVEAEAPQSETAGSGAAAPSGGFSFTATGQNAYIVTSYIRSRAILDDLSKKLDLKEVFRRPEADFWARLNRGASIDEFTEYWKGMVATFVDPVSSIVTVRIRAFRRDDALRLGRAVVETSEALVNRISERARRDATAMAEKEVRRAFAGVQSALAELHKFRNDAKIIDPGQSAGEIGKLLVPLMSEKIKLESELFVVAREMANDAPTVRVLREKLATTEAQVKDLKAKLTGEKGSTGTIASSLAKFEELEIQRQLTERFYMLAQADLDRAQLRANRQSVYLTVFVPPSLPEESRYPRRIAFSLLTFAGLTAVWAIIAMIYASVEDHRI